MDKTELQIFIGKRVVESKMSKDAKLQMLKFIQNEAEDYQLKAMALDGGIVTLDEQSQHIVEDRFHANVDLRFSIANEALSAHAKDMLFSKYNRMFGECAKKCGRIAISGEARDCKLKCTAQRDKAIAAARKAQRAEKSKQNAKYMKEDKAIEEAMSAHAKDLIFGPINRMFGTCAKKCGRIAISGKARDCKLDCTSRRDEAIANARAKIRASTKD